MNPITGGCMAIGGGVLSFFFRRVGGEIQETLNHAVVRLREAEVFDEFRKRFFGSRRCRRDDAAERLVPPPLRRRSEGALDLRNDFGVIPDPPRAAGWPQSICQAK